MSNSLVKLEVRWSLTHLKSICWTLRTIYQKMWKISVLAKTRNDLKWPEATYNEQKATCYDLQPPTMSKKRPEMTYNEQDTTWNDPQRVRHNLQWPERTYNKQRKDAKWPATSRFSHYFTIWGKRFSSLTHFPSNIWLQSFKHCFTKNHGENRASSIYYHASSINYHVYFLQHIIFVFFCVGFVSAGKGRGYYFSSSLSLPSTSQIVWSSTFAFIGEV